MATEYQPPPEYQMTDEGFAAVRSEMSEMSEQGSC